MVAENIRVTGIVQGVGFRPTVWWLAHECEIAGRVWNDAEGVLIQAWGERQALDNFVLRIESEQPPLARIDSIHRKVVDHSGEIPSDFSIVISREGENKTAVAADAATCSACLAEIGNSNNRRYRYPFTNCTHCGPRLSIIKKIPYDRVNTSMGAFSMCANCQAEYQSPADRRFHAQPNACSECGPQVWLENADGQPLSDPKFDAIQTAAKLIREGKIVAIKGIGGIHLACDAGNDEAVGELRQRKHRYYKALALMASGLDMVRRYADVDKDEAELLQDKAAPIVVLNAQGESLAEGVAPGQNRLGFMLPYTPLHHLLMQEMKRPIVLTSGNSSEEPQTITNCDARQRLAQIADYFLLHDRDIVNRLDDSVLLFADGHARFLRRARGYAPQPISLPTEFADMGNILAMGSELKNTFCLLKDGNAILSPHMGDLEDTATFLDYRRNLALFRQLFDFKPDMIVVDRHPNYLSTQMGKDIAAEENLPLIEVQHHHAHIAACMAELGLSPYTDKVLGVALDGLGYGDDETIWGGEFLLCDYHGFERVGFFQPVPMLGGTQAIHEPWRNTFAHLYTGLDWSQIVYRYGDLNIVRYLQNKPLTTMKTMIERGLNSPMASSAGRLFDAVAAAIGICRDRAAFEGQAAMELEALAADEFQRQADNGYGFDNSDQSLVWQPMWCSLLDDLKQGEEPAVIAARFHQGLARAVAKTALRLSSCHGTEKIVLSGGVFQNRLLLEQVSGLLREQGLRVLSPRLTPANDGGLSLGQVAIAAVRNST